MTNTELSILQNAFDENEIVYITVDAKIHSEDEFLSGNVEDSEIEEEVDASDFSKFDQFSARVQEILNDME